VFAVSGTGKRDDVRVGLTPRFALAHHHAGAGWPFVIRCRLAQCRGRRSLARTVTWPQPLTRAAARRQCVPAH
jgi:hypothetical protein